MFLHELDLGRRISTAVGKLTNVGRLEIWKMRVTRQLPKPLKEPGEWMAVQAQVLNRVKLNHLAKAKTVMDTRRAQKLKYRCYGPPYCIAEEFLIDFKETGVQGRKLEYPSELVREGVDDGSGHFSFSFDREPL